MPNFSVPTHQLEDKNEAKECFYQALDDALYQIPKSDKILLPGDFSARLVQNNRIWSGVLRYGVMETWYWQGECKWHEATYSLL